MLWLFVWNLRSVVAAAIVAVVVTTVGVQKIHDSKSNSIWSIINKFYWEWSIIIKSSCCIIRSTFVSCRCSSSPNHLSVHVFFSCYFCNTMHLHCALCISWSCHCFVVRIVKNSHRLIWPIQMFTIHFFRCRHICRSRDQTKKLIKLNQITFVCMQINWCSRSWSSIWETRKKPNRITHSFRP